MHTSESRTVGAYACMYLYPAKCPQFKYYHTPWDWQLHAYSTTSLTRLATPSSRAVTCKVIEQHSFWVEKSGSTCQSQWFTTTSPELQEELGSRLAAMIQKGYVSPRKQAGSNRSTFLQLVEQSQITTEAWLPLVLWTLVNRNTTFTFSV